MNDAADARPFDWVNDPLPLTGANGRCFRDLSPSEQNCILLRFLERLREDVLDVREDVRALADHLGIPFEECADAAPSEEAATASEPSECAR